METKDLCQRLSQTFDRKAGDEVYLRHVKRHPETVTLNISWITPPSQDNLKREISKVLDEHPEMLMVIPLFHEGGDLYAINRLPSDFHLGLPYGTDVDFIHKRNLFDYLQHQRRISRWDK